MSEIVSSSPERAISAGEAVARILACADVAVDSIAESAERQVRQMEAGAEAREYDDAATRQARLEQLRRELSERAAELATSYAAVTAQLGEIDYVLAQFGRSPAERAAEDAENEARVAAIKMTLRERRRIPVFSEQAAVETAPAEHAAHAPPGSGIEAEPGFARAPATSPPAGAEAPAPAEQPPADTSVGWRLWHRAA